jgi:hypothetical protein
MLLELDKAYKMITEIRIYKFKENAASEFQKVFAEQSLPMMKRWKVDVVDFGFSLIDKDSFYLIRNYESLEHRKESQEAFYGSDEWINGPEKTIMSCIDTYNTSVLDSKNLIKNKTDSK